MINANDIIFVEDLSKSEEFRIWVLTLLRAIKQMQVEGLVTGNDWLNIVLNKDDGVNIDILLKSIEDGTKEGQEWLSQIADATQKEVYSRKLGGQ